jgi:hypothetical protein
LISKGFSSYARISLRPRTVHQLFTVTVLPLVVLQEPAPGLE